MAGCNTPLSPPYRHLWVAVGLRGLGWLLAGALLVMPALPASAHTRAAYDAWVDEWTEACEGMTRQCLTELWDFLDDNPKRPAAVKTGGVEQWRSLVASYFRPGDIETALCLMALESGGNPSAQNPRSSAAGLFQILDSWWDKYGGSRYDPEDNVRLAAIIRDVQGWGAWSPYGRGSCRGW